MNKPETIETSDGWFVRQDYPTIQDGWVVRYKLDSDRWDGEINASRNGWSIQGHWPQMHESGKKAVLHTVRKAFVLWRALSGRGADKPLPEEQVERIVVRLVVRLLTTNEPPRGSRDSEVSA